MAGQKTDERDAHLGRRMAEERKRNQLTQKRVAQSFGMSAAQLQKYEKGVNRISAIHLEILSRMTGVPIAQFFDGIPRLGDAGDDGFGESDQAAFNDAAGWDGFASLVARHVSDNFSESNRREFASAIDRLQRELAR